MHKLGKQGTFVFTLFAMIIPPTYAVEFGPLEIHSAVVTPAPVSGEQRFKVTYIGYNLLWGTDQFHDIDLDKNLLYLIDVDGEDIFLEYRGPGLCISPGLTPPLDYRPHQISFEFPGLPAGQYDVHVDMVFSCGDGRIDFEHPLTIYDVPDKERIVYLETPVAQQTISGVSLVRGWACYTTEGGGKIGEISYKVDSGPLTPVAYGDSRADTEGRCGRHNTLTGFAAAEFWGKYGKGEHEFILLVDGEEVERRSFFIATPEEGFLRGIEAESTIDHFPVSGQSVRIEWSEADQNFVIRKFY